MMFLRIKPLDASLRTAEQRTLARSLGAFQLTLLGVGATIGTGIFVLTAAAAQKAGPAMMLSFVIAGLVCALAALCYSELAAMAPISGSAYTFSYAAVGELPAWLVGWALVLEYAVSASAVAVGWSGYFVGLLGNATGIRIPEALVRGPVWSLQGLIPQADFSHGVINLPAFSLVLLVTALLVIGTKESARINALLVVVKISALLMFAALALPALRADNFIPFMPGGWFGPDKTHGMGMIGAAASIFFAYVGFDAVSTAAEETRNPQRNVPLALLVSLGICTFFYILVAAGAAGAIGAQPVLNAAGVPAAPGSAEFSRACALPVHAQALVCSNEALAHVLRVIGKPAIGNLLGVVANLALPSVVLMMIYGQTRIFFVMAHDGLLPASFGRIHTRFGTPHVVTMCTGLFVAVVAALLPIGRLADISNSGTLFAFSMVCLTVLLLRRREPDRQRPFQVPAIWVIAPIAAAGCTFLFLNLPFDARLVLPVWGCLGLLIYVSYGYRNSHLARVSGPAEKPFE
jgi:APA family basic amino acid/polyamine antiporter